jgi:hypothetical protein
MTSAFRPHDRSLNGALRRGHRIEATRLDISALPEDAMREIRDRITTKVRFNSVVETGVPGFYPRAAVG